MKLQTGAYVLERGYSKNLEDEEKYQNWMKKTGLSQATIDTFVKESDITLERFKRVLNNTEEPELLAELEWVDIVNRIIDNEYSGKELNVQSDLEDTMFHSLYVPFINYGLHLILDKIKELPREALALLELPSLKKNILSTIAERIYRIGLKVMITEINMARECDLLSGCNEKERYESFIREFLEDREYLHELMESYPVMARLMVENIHNTGNAMFEIIRHFSEDHEELGMFFGSEAEKLIHIDFGAGDTHQNGKTVAILTIRTKEGSERKLVYKPRSLLMDEKFNELLHWINEHGFKKELRNLKTVTRKKYGYQEFIVGEKCSSVAEVENYYYRQGGYIALFYILNSTDFHHENIIANGEYPVFIDLETLFSNTIELDEKLNENKSAFINMSLEMKDSVFQSLMLPAKFNDEPLIEYDLSGMGITGEHEVEPSTVNAIDNMFSDEIKMVKKNIKLTEFNNTPSLNQNKENASDYIQEIINGFSDMYEIFLNNKHVLLSEDSPLYLFKETRARQVFRPTEAYSRFIDASIHPKYLQDGVERESLFYYLWHGMSFQPKLSRITKFEVGDLLRNDVPYFTFNVSSTSLYSSDEIEIHDFFKKSSIDGVKQKINRLSLEDRDHQSEFIRLSIDTLNREKEKDFETYGIHEIQKEVSEIFDKGRFVEEAKLIGDELVKRAIVADDYRDALWFGLNLDSHEQFKLSPLGLDLYNGSLGIVLYLGILAHETKDETYKGYAEAGLKYIEGRMNEGNQTSLSAFSGYVSLSYVCAFLGAAWEDGEMTEKSRSYISKVNPEFIERESNLDFSGGLSGALHVLVRIHEKFHFPEILPICDGIVHRLLPFLHMHMEKGTLLTGLAHGAAGYGWPLLEYARMLDTKELDETIRQLLAYENKHMNQKCDNWLDLRGSKAEDAPAFWCHGAGGIGLSRMRMRELEGDESYNEDIRKALVRLSSHGFGVSHTLCHGDFGNLDFFISYSKTEQNEEYRETANVIGSLLVQQKDRNGGWVLNQGRDTTILGFMIGISGIGYQLLRLNNPALPSVLSLELP